MSKIIITSDSTCALPRDEAAKIGLNILPLNAIVNGVEYHDGIDIDYKGLCKMMRDGANVKTSTPTPFEIESFFDNLFAQGADYIIHFTISHKLSSMYDLFTKVCAEKYGDKVKVIDSLAICVFMLNHVYTAREMIAQGASINEVVAAIEERKKAVYVKFVPETLTYLKRGGRISPAVALIGNLINLKPILCFKEGGLDKVGVTRSLKKTIVDILQEYANSGLDPERYAIDIIEADSDPALIEYAQNKAKELCPQYVVNVSPLSLNVVAHTGPGTIGLGLTLKPCK